MTDCKAVISTHVGQTEVFFGFPNVALQRFG